MLPVREGPAYAPSNFLNARIRTTHMTARAQQPAPDHIASYYAASSLPQPELAALKGEVLADVCVVGGGFSGLNTALELAERGLSVVLLEAHRIGWGASGRNGGQLIRGV